VLELNSPVDETSGFDMTVGELALCGSRGRGTGKSDVASLAEMGRW